MNQNIVALMAATTLIGLGGVNQAKASFDYTINDGGLLGNFSVTIDSTHENGIEVGAMNFAETHSGSGVPGYSQFKTVCLDLEGRLTLGNSYSFYEQSFAGQVGLNPAWGATSGGAAAAQGIQNAAFLMNHFTQTGATSKDWAALQLAVWSVLYNTDASGHLTGSRFSVQSDNSSGAWSEAQSWLAGFQRTQDYTGYLLKPLNGTAQEVLIGISPTPVPEPTTLLSGALLLLPMGLAGCRSFRKSLARN